MQPHRNKQACLCLTMNLNPTPVLAITQDFFKDLGSWSQFFQQTKRSGRCDGELLHTPHMELMNKRLEAVTDKANYNQVAMDYILCRSDVLGYIEAAEDNVLTWTAKCGHQEDVETTLADFVVSVGCV